jgi:hypothetical protein
MFNNEFEETRQSNNTLNVHAIVQREMSSFINQLENRISTLIQKQIEGNRKYSIEMHAEAIEQITSKEPLDNAKLTEIYKNLQMQLNHIKVSTNINEFMRHIHDITKRFKTIESKLTDLKKENNRLNEEILNLTSEKYVQKDITREDLEVLYVQSGASIEQIKSYLDKHNDVVQKNSIYRTMQCTDNNIMRRQRIKQFLTDLIKEQKIA